MEPSTQPTHRRHPESAGGFTLIEILVVVAIIAIFATAVAINVGGKVPEAKITKAKSDLQSLENAVEQFYMDNSFYPTTDQGLQALVAPPTVGRQARNFRDGGYIKRLPLDPWGMEYRYLSPGGPIGWPVRRVQLRRRPPAGR